ncbi:MAG: organic solvent tolerance protein OstA [Pirellulaceae bacterium]|nr:organic solvent tolerance protein OstA [Pirellulaceae bacterium]
MVGQLAHHIAERLGSQTAGWRLRRRCALLTWLLLAVLSDWRMARAQIALPTIDPAFQIEVVADEVAKERRGEYDVLAFSGGCKLTQGGLTAGADEIVLWIERQLADEPQQPGKIICYLKGSMRLDWSEGQSLRDEQWMGRLYSLYPVRYQAQRDVRRFDIPNLDWSREPSRFGAVQLAQFSHPLPAPATTSGGGLPPLPTTSLLNQPTKTPVVVGNSTPVPPSSNIPSAAGAIPWNPTTGGGTVGRVELPSVGLVLPEDGSAPYPAVSPQPPEPIAIGMPAPQLLMSPQIPPNNPFAAKSVQFSQRNSNSRIEFKPDPATGQTVAEVRGGFKLVVAGIQVAQPDGSLMDFGTISLEADNAVVWLHSQGEGSPFSNLVSTPEHPIELYLDGNIVFNQGNRVIYADRMYYNVSSEYGTVLAAEMLTPVPQYQGLLRLKADVLQQQDRRNFRAYGAAITSSRLGLPRYWLQSREVEFVDQRDDGNLSVYSPSDARRPTNMLATSRSNFLYLSGLPILFWPNFSTNLSEPSFYLTGVSVDNDKIFGTQAYLDWDVYQLLGIQGPQGTKLKLSTNYLSKRGFSLGGRFDYDGPTWLFGAPGVGFSDAWFIDDQGQDFLGRDRTDLTPEKTFRGRTLSRNRLYFSPNVELISETGWISDRNFLEQYFENEWDQEKDLDTAARLRRYNGNRLFEVFGQARFNKFFTETEWLPRVNHYWLGQDLLGQRFTWNAFTNVGYAHQRVATTPVDPVDAAKFAPLGWESDSEGLRARTRQELSLPMALGVWKIVPFVSGEAGFWNEDIAQQEVTRLSGQAGVRTALPLWSANANVENRLFDLRGLAHKVTLKSDIFFADTNQDLDRFPLFDPLDDNSQEHFRRRFIFDTFGGALPKQFDERNYAVRSGMQRWVTAYSGEIFERTQQARFGIDQRWQTKRGLPGRERIVDLVTLDFDMIYFPRPDRDNFGEDVGGLNYDFRYHIGDRLTLLSDGYADVFADGLKTISVGANVSRPGRGDAYIGMLSIEGPISASILNGYVNYRLNEKWIVSSGAAYDFGQAGSIGQSLALTRIGETALIRMGVNVDRGRDNVSFNFNIEPRFLPTRKLGQLGGQLIAPAGLFGVE